jgi:hypothetical protein
MEFGSAGMLEDDWLLPGVHVGVAPLLSFNEYVNDDGTEVGVVQVHPDAVSMEFHMGVVAERAARACAETLEATTSIQVYGEPGDAVLEMLRRAKPALAFRWPSSGTTSEDSRGSKGAESNAVANWTPELLGRALALG